MSCLVLAPVKACGFGFCENVTTCICESGFSHSIELNYFLDDDSSLLSGPCLYHEEIVNVLYNISAIVSSLVFSIEFCFRINSSGPSSYRKKVLKRWLPVFMTLLCFAIATIYRSVRKHAFLGEDVVFSFFISNGIAFVNTSLTQNLLKYVYYLVKKEEWSSRNVEVHVLAFKRWEPFWRVLDIGLAQLWWLTCFVSNQGTLLIMMRTFLVGTLVRQVYVLVFASNFIKKYLVDLEIIARYKGNMSDSEKLEENKEMYAWVQSHQPRIKFLKFSLLAYFNGAVFMVFLPLVWNLVFLLLTYLIPIVCIWFSISVVYVSFRDFRFKRKKKRQQKYVLNQISRNGNENLAISAASRNNFKKQINKGREVVRQETVISDNQKDKADVDDDSDDELI